MIRFLKSLFAPDWRIGKTFRADDGNYFVPEHIGYRVLGKFYDVEGNRMTDHYATGKLTVETMVCWRPE